jgi:hypothetical protein
MILTQQHDHIGFSAITKSLAALLRALSCSGMQITHVVIPNTQDLMTTDQCLMSNIQ